MSHCGYNTDSFEVLPHTRSILPTFAIHPTPHKHFYYIVEVIFIAYQSVLFIL